MVKRLGGNRRKSRAKMRKQVCTRGKISITNYLAKYEDGDKVQLKAEPAIQTGIYHLDYHGNVGIIKGKQGECYKVLINNKNKEKTLIVHPIHLKRLKQ
jgi:large subunit ribosomal protein L21e